MRLFSNRSQRTSKCGKNISDTFGCASCGTFLFLPHFDVNCDLLLNRRRATWNLFVKSLQLISATLSDPHNPPIIVACWLRLKTLSHTALLGEGFEGLFLRRGNLICCNTKEKVCFLTENVKWPQDILWLIVGFCVNSLFSSCFKYIQLVHSSVSCES